MTAAGDARRVADMVEMLDDIRDRMRPGWDAFSGDVTQQKVVAYDLMVLGEAASKVSRRTQSANPKVPWTVIVEYRNELIHEYGSLDLKATWEFVTHRLPGLERDLRRVRVVPSPDE